MSNFSNALLLETSPYLLQHAHNPVQWYPWNDEALNLAKQQNKPILLSIGYSACHWCHVMAHESFENEETAALMNQHFINIKVDREERPDLDKIYQLVHQIMQQRPGGWPLTVVLSPQDHYPFFAGTYFPAQPSYGMPSFSQLLMSIADFYQKKQTELGESKQALSQAIQQYESPRLEKNVQIDPAPLNTIRAELGETFESKHGGFGQAPKFPHLSNIERLMNHYSRSRQQGQIDQNGLAMAHFSLTKMALGGIYDHLGGGFCRYSVDEYWMIPHFEKMLYDNGPFLAIYADAWQCWRGLEQGQEKGQEALFKRTATEIADWVIREMQSPEGGFYSTQDADSEGEEGKFYVWSPEQVKPLLSEEDYDLFAKHFGLDRTANFEGNWHLHVYAPDHELETDFELSQRQVREKLDQARSILFQHREKRIKPGRDEKVLTSWNGLMIKGLAKAGLIFKRADYIQAAQKTVDFIQNTLWVDGRLLATYKDGKAHLNAYLDDYAFLLDALLNLLQAQWRDKDLAFAIQLAEVLLVEFEDPDQGGFYFTAHHHEALISRPKSFSDDSIPSGNAIAAYALGRLGHLLGENRYLQATEKAIKLAWPSIQQMPMGHASMFLALEDYLFPPQTIILRGNIETIKLWQETCLQNYAPQRICFAIPDGAQNLPGTLAGKKSQGEGIAYICEGHQCLEPVTSIEGLMKL